jgi:Xaa-Pro aminopeptidase
MKKASLKTARCIVAASEHNADMLYATRFMAPDPFIYWEWQGKRQVAFNRLEIDRARKQIQVDIVHAIEDFKGKTTAETLASIAQKQGFNSIQVPSDFPLALADALRKKGLKLSPVQGAFFPKREIKSAHEIACITRAQRMAEAGLKRAIEILKQTKINSRGYLTWHGTRLTSERLRGEIDATIIKLGGLPAGTIVAGGEQACDPHERGSGPLRAHQAIIIDIFPRDSKSGYFGDLTRTLLRGKASEALKKLHYTVAVGQALALKKMCAGVDGKKIHDEVLNFFKTQGYPTEKSQGRWVGFFHGIGHSLGLEIHESPRFAAGRFKAGQVMTVEPGLYYPKLGGVRIEDLVVIKKNGIQNLTQAPKQFVI